MTGDRTYLDYNASAPLRPEAREAMLAALDAEGNPSSVHAEGRRARRLVDEARESVAALVNANPADVVFTSGATEANAWAISGALSGDLAPDRPGNWATAYVSAIEHESVRAPAARFAVVDVLAARNGQADLSAMSPLPSGHHALIALQMANNETGVLQPVAEAGLFAAEHGYALHTDAVQAAGRVTIDFKALGVTTLSLSSHKIGGPKGAGALVIRAGASLVPLITGGGQERRRRAGTENVAAIAGFGAAAQAAQRDLMEISRIAALRDRLEAEVLRLTPSAVIIGRDAPRIANTSCIALPGQVAETLVIKLDLAGIAVSAGSACSSGKVGASHVLAAMGLPAELSRAAIRVSLGSGSTAQDIAAFLAAWSTLGGEGQLAA